MVVTGSVVTVITLFCLAYYLSRRSQGYPLTNGSNRYYSLDYNVSPVDENNGMFTGQVSMDDRYYFNVYTDYDIDHG